MGAVVIVYIGYSWQANHQGGLNQEYKGVMPETPAVLLFYREADDICLAC